MEVTANPGTTAAVIGADGDQEQAAVVEGFGGRALLDALSDAVLAVSAEGHVVFANVAASDVLGCGDHVMGSSLTDWFAPGTRASAAQALQAALSGRSNRAATALIDGLGPGGNVLLICLPLRQGGRVAGAACLLRAFADGCSDRPVSWQEEAEEQARAVESLKGELLQVLNHELRTPLTVVLGLASTLRRHHASLPTEELLRMLWRIERAAHQVHGRLEDLEVLSVGRRPNGTVSLAREEVDLAEVVGACLADQEVTAGVQIMAELSSVRSSADVAMVGRAVEHLIRNAVRHTPEGTSVWVRILEGPEIVVEDDGPGLPCDQRERLFAVFEQGDLARRAPKPGTGVGLAFARRVAREHGGDLTYRDRVGGGAALHLRLA